MNKACPDVEPTLKLRKQEKNALILQLSGWQKEK